MTKHQIEVITSVERRRRWFREEKERVFAATFEAVARRGVRRDGIASRFHDRREPRSAREEDELGLLPHNRLGGAEMTGLSSFEKRVVFGLAAIAQSASCSMLVMQPLSCCVIFIVRPRKRKGSDGRLSAGYSVVRPIHQLLEKLSLQPRLKQDLRSD